MHRGISADDLIKMARVKSEKFDGASVEMSEISNLSQSSRSFFYKW